MPCHSPLTAWYTTAGTLSFQNDGTKRPTGDLKIPCGKCTGCYLERSRQWAIRLMHEKQVSNSSYFLTLTFRPAELNRLGWSLRPECFTTFMKRYRHHFGKCRYYMVGEYGTRFLRPHFHVCMFGESIGDLMPLRVSQAGFQTYQSFALDECWGHGEANVAELTFESAAYCARYMMDKPTTEQERKKRYERIDPDTGEVFQVIPEYSRMSLRPAIAKEWMTRFQNDVYPHDYVVTREGKKSKPPRAYDKWYEEKEPDKFEKMKQERRAEAKLKANDNTPARLKVKKQIAEATLQLKARNYE